MRLGVLPLKRLRAFNANSFNVHCLLPTLCPSLFVSIFKSRTHYFCPCLFVAPCIYSLCPMYLQSLPHVPTVLALCIYSPCSMYLQFLPRVPTVLAPCLFSPCSMYVQSLPYVKYNPFKVSASHMYSSRLMYI